MSFYTASVRAVRRCYSLGRAFLSWPTLPFLSGRGNLVRTLVVIAAWAVFLVSGALLSFSLYYSPDTLVALIAPRHARDLPLDAIRLYAHFAGSEAARYRYTDAARFIPWATKQHMVAHFI